MFRRFATAATLFSALAACAFAQGLETSASKDDWEEINFEFDSAVLSDGYPSLLRLAELLKNHAGYRVKVEGYTDVLGSAQYNEKLGMSRASTVKDFLVKYGAAAGQITVGTKGKENPKYPGQKPGYTKTDVARWMNRRVVLTVTDDQGRMVSAGGPGDAIRAMDTGGMKKDCCDEILKRLDKLDEIARMLKDLADQNANLKKEVDALKAGRQTEQAQQQQQQATRPVEIAKEVEKLRDPRFSLLGVNLGADSLGNITFSGRGRYFAPFKEHFAIQAQAEYNYYKTQREGQFDIGIVDRFDKSWQVGLFSSFKHVTLQGNQSGGTLGQGAFTLDYLFKYGKVGIFGTKSFLDNALIDSRNALVNGNIAPNLYVERYLRVVDQAGASATVALFGKNYVEANLGYLRSFGHADRPGGTVRFVFPVTDKIAFTLEGGINETLLDAGHTGRAMAGVQFGNFIHPKDYATVDHPVPVDIPRVRYEVLTRTVHKGVTAPIADAGPDQIGVKAGTITLDGSKSYDPNGEQLTYSWVQESGNTVALAAANAAVTTFQAAEGQNYSFRLTVTNTDGLSGSARVRVTTQSALKVQIVLFNANPSQIQKGQSSTLSWRVLNADSVTLSSVGTVQSNSSTTVSPTDTTTYTLTAKNATSQDSATVTVTVGGPGGGGGGAVSFLNCYVTPTNIMPGESATLNWSTQNAVSVVLGGVGNVALSGTQSVSPAATTTYTLTATGADKTTSVCNLTLNVGAQNGTLPRIILFNANPGTINQGQSSYLIWQVENADAVSISSLGTVALNGNQQVSPQQTTTYTLTATNKQGQSTANATITVNVPPPPPQAPVITSFTANPTVSSPPGSPVTLNCQAKNATSVVISGVGPVAADGTLVVKPLVQTTYVCVATGPGGQDNKQLTVTTATGPTNPGNPPTIIIKGGNYQETVVRQLQIDASASTSPVGNNPLTFSWVSRNTTAAVLNPTSPTPTVQLGQDYGDYFFDLTVTDSKGQTSTQTVTVRLVVTRVQ